MAYERSFTDRHGIEVGFRACPVPAPQAVMLVAHGASEHSGRYGRFAGALATAGFASYAIDHRGHGRTSAATGPGRMGPPGGVALVDDLQELRRIAEDENPNVPVFIFGHSMGSAITLAYITQHAAGLAGAVLCGFPVPIDAVPALAEGFRAAADAGQRDDPADVLSYLNDAFEPARTPFDWLSRDPDEVDRYLNDPFCGNNMPLTYGFFVSLFEIVAPALDPSALRAISCPVLLVAGGDDPAGDNGAHPTALHDALQKVGVRSKLTLYPGARHELLNEVNRGEVTADVIEWAGHTTAALAS